MNPIEELDLARAKAMCEIWEGSWPDVDAEWQASFLKLAACIRESDAKRGLVVVPKRLVKMCGNNNMNCPHAPQIKDALAKYAE